MLSRTVFLILVVLMGAMQSRAQAPDWKVAVVFLDSGTDLKSDIYENLKEIRRLPPEVKKGISVYHQSSGASLEKFLIDSFFGSQKRLLFLYGHGFGYKGMGGLSVQEIKRLLSVIPERPGAPNIDIVWFDSCYMANIEFLYELRNYSHYTIASQDAEFSSGFPFEALSLLNTHQFSHIGKEAKALAFRFLESYSFSRNGSQTGSVESSSAQVSVIENSKLEGLVSALSGVSYRSLGNLSTVDLDAWSMKTPAFIDLGHLLEGRALPELDRLLGLTHSTQVKASVSDGKYNTRDFWIRYRNIVDSPLLFVGASVVAGNSSHDRYSGFTIANPFRPILSMDYYNLEFYLRTGWTQK